MRIYIIGNDGITLCREPPATVNEGEIVVASSEELHAARISGKQLLALWNALPGVEKRRKVGDREALVDQLWSAIEMLPDPEPQSDAKRPSKQAEVIAMLRRPEGVTVDEVASATGWQRHTVRGLIYAIANVPAIPCRRPNAMIGSTTSHEHVPSPISVTHSGVSTIFRTAKLGPPRCKKASILRPSGSFMRQIRGI